MTDAIALALAAAGCACAGAGVLRRAVRTHGLALMLDLWLAAGLLRLSTTLSWTNLAAMVGLIGVRKLVLFALHHRVSS